MTHIKIVCAKSWGKLGNFSSAKTIATGLRGLGTVDEVEVLPIEEVWPKFGDWGAKMQSAAESFDPNLVSDSFDHICSEIEQALSAGLTPPLNELNSALQCSDVVIGTKGIISRFLNEARHASQSDIDVLNWVTNSGLLKLAMHSCPDVDGHFVPLGEDAELIYRDWGVPKHKIHTVGPPVSLANLVFDKDTSSSSKKPLIVAYFNFLAPQCSSSVAKIMSEINDVNVTVLYAAADPNAVRALQELECTSKGKLTCRTALQHVDFLELLKQLSAAPRKLLIAKSGPNTMFEAISLGIPMVLYRSGIPQEDWVGPYAQHNGIGEFVETIDAIAPAVVPALNKERQNSFTSNLAKTKARTLVPAQIKDTIISNGLALPV